MDIFLVYGMYGMRKLCQNRIRKIINKKQYYFNTDLWRLLIHGSLIVIKISFLKILQNKAMTYGLETIEAVYILKNM
jgi:hypothetical protein